jgi:hypothetical protein
MDNAFEEKLCARLDACLGATLKEMWEAFGSVLHRHTGEGVELIFLLVLSVLFGATNPAQLHQLLGLKGHPLYKQINALTPRRWKKLLQQLCYQAAAAQLEVLAAQSPATQSRACAVIALDDTLIRRLGKKLGLVWTWWEGMSHRVGRGQNIIALVLVLGDRVIPLDVRIASKQGRVKLTKPLLAERMLRDWEAQWKQLGLSRQQVKLVADSWYPSQDLFALCRELNLEAITEGKGSYCFAVEGEKIKASELKKGPLTTRWGASGAALRIRASHPAFGEVVLVGFAQGTKRRYVIATGLARRAHEILRAYHQRAQIEAFWKRLKSILQIAKIRLPTPKAFRGALICRVLTYLLVDELTRKLQRYPAFGKLTMEHTIHLCQRFSSVIDWIEEHFHNVTIEKPNIVNYLKAI